MELEKTPKVIIVMGVSGSGKSLIAKELSQELGITYLEGDDYHPSANIDKMTEGIPLNDQDRLPWLKQLNSLAKDYEMSGCIISCSALKQAYRKILAHNLEDSVFWVFLRGSYDLILNRMKKRGNHFMHANMLRSQFDALEEPEDAFVVNVEESPAEIVNKIKKRI